MGSSQSNEGNSDAAALDGKQPDAFDGISSLVFPTFEDHHIEKKYELGAVLGAGAFAEVRLATYKKTGTTYAVKCIKKQGLDELTKADLMDEVAVLREMAHPNVVNVYQFYPREKDHFYVIMEYMKGGELFERIVAKQVYTEKEARAVCRVLLATVRYLHDHDVVHRDLKPDNLLLTSDADDANIKLADFGFAKKLDGQKLTQLCGTPNYIAPEILLHEPYGVTVDMWSLGCIIYILLGGYLPFVDDNQTRLFRKIRNGAYSFHPEYWSDISDEAKDLIRGCLNVDAEKRLTAAQAMEHPWLAVSDDCLGGNCLDKSLERLQLFNARRKLRGAIRTVMTARHCARQWNAVADDKPTAPAS
ncbi:putative calcium/calmodulin-dependent protein kinase [Tribonema minus]|uniref:non-specific serine/threonine protein kinase n=1 Tax=Tribonema minus TaxID=303371 RepID=A0A836CHL2_9STRA|nr:putative calcium/calmodulin-dependent protein kinase [Tribonema minus]